MQRLKLTREPSAGFFFFYVDDELTLQVPFQGMGGFLDFCELWDSLSDHRNRPCQWIHQHWKFFEGVFDMDASLTEKVWGSVTMSRQYNDGNSIKVSAGMTVVKDEKVPEEQQLKEVLVKSASACSSFFKELK